MRWAHPASHCFVMTNLRLVCMRCLLCRPQQWRWFGIWQPSPAHGRGLVKAGNLSLSACILPICVSACSIVMRPDITGLSRPLFIAFVDSNALAQQQHLWEQARELEWAFPFRQWFLSLSPGTRGTGTFPAQAKSAPGLTCQLRAIPSLAWSHYALQGASTMIIPLGCAPPQLHELESMVTSGFNTEESCNLITRLVAWSWHTNLGASSLEPYLGLYAHQKALFDWGRSALSKLSSDQVIQAKQAINTQSTTRSNCAYKCSM